MSNPSPDIDLNSEQSEIATSDEIKDAKDDGSDDEPSLIETIRGFSSYIHTTTISKWKLFLDRIPLDPYQLYGTIGGALLIFVIVIYLGTIHNGLGLISIIAGVLGIFAIRHESDTITTEKRSDYVSYYGLCLFFLGFGIYYLLNGIVL